MNLSIKEKLIGGYTIILVLLILLIFFIAGKLSESNERLLKLMDVSSRKVNLSNEMMIGVLQAGRHEKNIILESDPIRKEYYKERIYQALAVIEEKNKEAEKLADAEAKIIFAEFDSTWEDYKSDLAKIISLSMQNKDDEAFKISIEKGYRVREKTIQALNKLIDKNETSMQNDKAESISSYNSSLNLIIILVIAAIILTVIISLWIIQSITWRISLITKEAAKIASREFMDNKLEDTSNDELKPVFSSLISINESFREITENANIVAAGNYAVDLIPRSEKDILGHALRRMTYSLREKTTANETHNWISTGQNQLNERLRGDQSVETLANSIVGFLCTYLNANIGAVYLFNENDNSLVLNGQYAFLSQKDTKEKFALSEGLIGQAAYEQKQISLAGITNEELRITSSVLNANPKHILVTPFVFEGRCLGVVELGKLSSFSETEQLFVKTSSESIAISINSAIARKRIQQLLEETQMQSEELQTQQEELKQLNEELEEQAQNLKQQQEELQATNEELEEQTQSLEIKNKEVEAAKHDIEQKTKQLEISSRYKSEFLANMSHELRTPLNSLLILSKDLFDNKTQNLNQEQVESAEIIYKSGCDLLTLINEVLDLSKIEAGKMTVTIERVELRRFINDLIRDFKHHAEQKKLQLIANLDNDLPESIRTDSVRLNQILKNLLSNAIKFTDRGAVTISIRKHSETTLNISVSDTGIGIPEEKQMDIFEAFQQVDGGTSRKYGGTGLGLSISRELAGLLNAEIKLSSKVNEGSVFTLLIPITMQSAPHEISAANMQTPPVLFQTYAENNSLYLNYPTINDDRQEIIEGDKVVLIIEDDLKFASILLSQANQKGFKCLSAATGEDGLVLATKYKPHAIILDLDLPGINGHHVLSKLKTNPAVRHIPVHIVSVNERSLEPIKEGAIEYIVKPVDKKQLEEAFSRIEHFISRKMKNLLIVEDDESSRKIICKLIGNGDVKCLEAATGHDALSMYDKNHIDCIVLDIGLPDMNGFDLIYKLESMQDRNTPPIIIYTGKELTKEENNELQKYAESIIIKGVKSEERLLDETALFLHRTIGNLPTSKQIIIHNLHNKEAVFQSKKILLVDDDMRNVFALSKILKEKGMEVIKADNGRSALEILSSISDIDLVLMDIMMPEMDGYEATKRIRANNKIKDLPIIALTAKAMKDDKQKCIDAGASDYITKPVDIERLLSLMRVWLSK